METISEAAVKWFAGRAIEPETLSRMGIYSGRRVVDRDERGEETARIVPDANGDVIVFPYVEDGVRVGEKYRGRPRPDGSKTIWAKTGSRMTFYNSDILLDPAMKNGSEALVIVEGEPDCLAVIEAGWPYVVSVPTGAPADKDKDGNPLPPVPASATDINPEEDNAFAYVLKTWPKTKGLKRIILFTDADGPGSRLADELARRYGRARCFRVSYPEGSKDANDVLMKHGADAVLAMIRNAKPYPLKGLYHLLDLPEPPPLTLHSTGFRCLDPERNPSGACALELTTGMFMVVLGKPASGKSTWTLQLAANMVRQFGWNVAICSPEMPIIPFMRDPLRTALIGKPRKEWERQEVSMADRVIHRHIAFITAEAEVDDEEDPSIEWLLEKAHAAVIRDGINMLIIDPWNELSHAWDSRRETETQYVERAIKKLKAFARMYGVLVCVVIHPDKEGGRTSGDNLTLYNAAGSAHWYNKADIGIIFAKDEEVPNTSNLHLKKLRFRTLGRMGKVALPYDTRTELFLT